MAPHRRAGLGVGCRGERRRLERSVDALLLDDTVYAPNRDARHVPRGRQADQGRLSAFLPFERPVEAVSELTQCGDRDVDSSLPMPLSGPTADRLRCAARSEDAWPNAAPRPLGVGDNREFTIASSRWRSKLANAPFWRGLLEHGADSTFPILSTGRSQTITR